MRFNNTITQERILELFTYNPTTGHLFNRINRGKAKAGELAGYTTESGYISTTVDGVHYFVHRLVWMYVHGVWPTELLDHINLARSDNRICNLREATFSQNLCNSKLRKDSTSGLKGCVFHRGTQKWQCRIYINGVRKHLGLYDSKQECYNAYVAASQLHYGEFANIGV